MSADSFFDSDILLCMVSEDAEKAARAALLLEAGGVVSVQVLNEFADVCLRKFAKPVPEIRRLLRATRALCSVEPIDIDTHELGIHIAERYRFHIFDSMIVASAIRAGCTTLYTEDLQHGQQIEGLTVRNPFTA